MAQPTLRELRREIAYEVAGVHNTLSMRVETCEAGSTPLQIQDSTLRSGNQQTLAGNWVIVNGEVRQVKAVLSDPLRLQLNKPLSAAPEAGDEYELYGQSHPPERLHSLINRAVRVAREHDVYEQRLEEEAYIGPYARRLKAPEGMDVVAWVEAADYYAYQWGYAYLNETLREQTGVTTDGLTFPISVMDVPTGAYTLPLEHGAFGFYERTGIEFHASVAGQMGSAPDANVKEIEAGWQFRSLPQSSESRQVHLWFSVPVKVYRIIVYQESAVEWAKVDGWRTYSGSGMIELPEPTIFYEGTRLRVMGGKELPLLNADSDLLPEPVPSAFVVAHALVTMLRTYGRSESEIGLTRDWERTAAYELAKLPRMQNLRHV